MSGLYGLHSSRNVGRASRGWWLQQVRTAVAMLCFSGAIVAGFFVVMSGSKP